MHRFYCPQLAPSKATQSILSDLRVQLEPTPAHHAIRVLRLATGDTVEVFDGQGWVGRGSLQCSGPSASVINTTISRIEPPRPTIDIAASIPTGPRAQAMVNQLSQAGADRLIPLITQRSIVQPRQAKLDRFEQTTIESAKQSGRAYLMKIDAPTPLQELVSGPEEVRLIADPSGQKVATGQIQLDKAARVLVLIGPEGGWTAGELQLATESGYAPWKLGPYVLRIETAACVATAILRHTCLG